MHVQKSRKQSYQRALLQRQEQRAGKMGDLVCVRSWPFCHSPFPILDNPAFRMRKTLLLTRPSVIYRTKKKEEIRSVTSEARRSKYRKADNNNNKKDHVLPGVNSVVFKKKKKTARTVSVSSRNVRPRLNRKKIIYIHICIYSFFSIPH